MRRWRCCGAGRLLLFCAAAVLAALEQVVLAPMRSWAYLSPPYYGPAEDHFQLWWLVTSLGFGGESSSSRCSASLAAAAAGPALLGRAVRDRAAVAADPAAGHRRPRRCTLGALGVLGAFARDSCRGCSSSGCSVWPRRRW